MTKQTVQSRWLAWLRLLRLSNAPTALADILMGLAVATGGALPSPAVCLAIGIASLLIYHGGMVLNDANDAPDDALERPERPIPSGVINRAAGYRMVIALFLLGVVAAGIAVMLSSRIAPLAIASALILLVVGYNSPLKKSFLGPLLMGACRGLNVLLGMSPALTWGAATAVAPGVLLYVAGVTWMATQEGNSTRRGPILWGAVVSIAGIAWLAMAPWVLTAGLWPQSSPAAWWLLWGVVALMIGRHFVTALLWPKPGTVRRAVGGAIQGIILIDAALAAAYVGPYWGMTVLLMLPLTLLAARFLPQT